MSTTTSPITLQDAILTQVQEFANDNKSFSIHDITTTLRRKTANGELEIPEVETSHHSFKFEIQHVKVKSIFENLWQTGGFDHVLTLNRQFNGTYFEYTATLINNSPAQAQPANVTANPVAGCVVTPAVFVSHKVTTAPPINDDSVKSRIRTYLNNCVTRNFRPTLKQVQSAIKRTSSTGWTCEKIGEFIEQDLGYTIVADPDFVSASQVAVV